MLRFSRHSVLLFSVLAGQVFATSPTTDAPQYGIKEERAATGTSIRSNLVEPISIPVNRSYGQLTAEERMRWHANYEGIADGDEPPFPVEGLKSILEPLAQAAQKLLPKGPMLLIATVDAAGDVQAVKAVGSPSSRMTRVAAEILMMTKFKPAICAGAPCQMDFPLHLHFKVK